MNQQAHKASIASEKTDYVLLAMSVKVVIGHVGRIEFDASKSGRMQGKRLDMYRLHRMSWPAGGEERHGLSKAYRCFHE